MNNIGFTPKQEGVSPAGRRCFRSIPWHLGPPGDREHCKDGLLGRAL